MASEFSYFGFTNSSCIAKPSLNAFKDLPNIKYVVEREIVSNSQGYNSESSGKYLYPPSYKLLDINGSRTTLKSGLFTLIDIQADTYDEITGLRILEDKTSLDHLFRPKTTYSLSKNSGLGLFKDLQELFEILNEVGTIADYNLQEKQSPFTLNED